MPKYYKKSYAKRVNRDKYSVEHKAGVVVLPLAPGQQDLIVVPSTDLEGMRKVKHVVISGSGASGAETTTGIYWALVYVPSGYAANTLTRTGGSLYEPNQNVMCAGVWDMNAGPLRVSAPTSRNLNSGDSIHLVIASTNTTATVDVSFYVQYAITLQ